MSINNESEIAMYHFYFVNAVLDGVPSESSIGEIFGMGEDGFVIEIFGHSKAWWKLADEHYNAGKESFGVHVYDLPARLSQVFWELVSEANGLPMPEVFAESIAPIVNEDFE